MGDAATPFVPPPVRFPFVATAYREEAVNATLTDAMSDLGAPSKAETIMHADDKKEYPDIRTERAGLCVVLEAKYDGPAPSHRPNT